MIRAAKALAIRAAAVLGQVARNGWRTRPSLRDFHVYGGALLIAGGASMYSEPAGLLVFGAALLYIGRP